MFVYHNLWLCLADKGEYRGFWWEDKLDWKETGWHNGAEAEPGPKDEQRCCGEEEDGGAGVERKRSKNQLDLLGETGKRSHHWLLRETYVANVLVKNI